MSGIISLGQGGPVAAALRTANPSQDGVFNLRPQCLKKWRRARNTVIAGDGRGRGVFVGDSTEAGSCANAVDMTGAFIDSPSNQLARILNRSGVAVSHNSIYGDQLSVASSVAYNAYDPRVTLGANWASNTFETLGGTYFKYTTGAANNLAFTPAGQIDTIKVFYWRAGGFGSFNTNVDGGASLGTTATAGASAAQTATFTVTKGAHTINIVPLNNGDLYINGIIAYDSTTPAVDFVQGARSGGGIANWSTNGGSNPYAAIEQIKYLAPDFLWANCTINNSNNDGLAYLPTYLTNMQMLITAAQISGDVILEVGPPSNTAAATNGTLDAYADALKALALLNNCVLINTKQRWVSYAEQHAVMPYRDTHHPTAVGYADIAWARSSVLMRY